jgi:hypothetical protein
VRRLPSATPPGSARRYHRWEDSSRCEGTMGAVRLSVSLSEDVASWLKAQAKAQHRSLSAVLDETVRQARRERALDEVLEWLEAPAVTPEELEEFEQRWGLASPSTPASSSGSNAATSRRAKRSWRRES